MNENRAREEICRVGQSLFQRGYVHASAGNISMRLEDGFLITPTDACLGFLDPARLSKVDHNLQPVSGDKPSKTVVLHRQIYQSACVFEAETSCVIHTHSTHCVALSMQHDDDIFLPALTPYFVMKVGVVPHIPYHRPGAPEVVPKVAQAIEHHGRRGQAIRAVMLQRLGPNVWNRCAASTMAALEELEETAKLSLLCARHGTRDMAFLDEVQIQELRQVFGARW